MIPGTAARQASLSFTTSRSLLKLKSIASVMPSNRLILCRSHQISLGIRFQIKFTANVTRLNHPETIPPNPQSVGKLSSMKLVPGPEQAGDRCLSNLNSFSSLSPRGHLPAHLSTHQKEGFCRCRNPSCSWKFSVVQTVAAHEGINRLFKRLEVDQQLNGFCKGARNEYICNHSPSFSSSIIKEIKG